MLCDRTVANGYVNSGLTTTNSASRILRRLLEMILVAILSPMPTSELGCISL